MTASAEPPAADDSHSTGSLVLTVLIRQAATLLLWGAIALAAWPLGISPGYPPVAAATMLIAGRPVFARYRTAPPRRRTAALLAAAVLIGTGLLACAATDLLLPDHLHSEDLDLLIATLAGTPAAVAVFSRACGRHRTAVG
ncbi:MULTISPECIES: hypothetical protein [unclassified Kitasatospora]|uniref:hypothetical protein n=1 Tax=unclassified Kitasatospora TaxID=2633591 RepID=UPI00380D938F